MTTDDRIERLLRRSADEVRAKVVLRTSPPPIEELGHGRGGRGWLTVAASLIVVVAGLVALAISIDGSGDGPAPPVATLPAASTAPLCQAVAAATTDLEVPPTDVAAWAAVGKQLDRVDAAGAEVDLTADGARRLDRFQLLAGLAVQGGLAGEQLPASARAVEAAAVGRDLVDFLAVPTCTVSDPSTGGTPPATPGGS
jgi:hypothetical protein